MIRGSEERRLVTTKERFGEIGCSVHSADAPAFFPGLLTENGDTLPYSARGTGCAPFASW